MYSVERKGTRVGVGLMINIMIDQENARIIPAIATSYNLHVPVFN